jgi:thiamine biosynthesis lipoprotein
MIDSEKETLVSFSRSLKLMGNQFELTAVHESRDRCVQAVEAGINEGRRIESLLTTFSEDSVTALINNRAGIEPVSVSDEVFYLVERCQRISVLTQGAFDISYGSVDKKYWNFDTGMTSLPDLRKAKKSVKLVGYRILYLIQKKRVFSLNTKECG